MNEYNEKINKIVEGMNVNSLYKYKLLECSEDFNFSLIECANYDTEYLIYKYSYHDGFWDLFLVRPYVSKDKAYAAYEALTASSYC